MALSGLNSSSEQKAAPPNWRGFFLAAVVNNILFLHRANDCGIIRHMIGLTDNQLKIIMGAARLIPGLK